MGRIYGEEDSGTHMSKILMFVVNIFMKLFMSLLQSSFESQLQQLDLIFLKQIGFLLLFW